MNEDMIFPEIFDGRVLGFFTDKELGIDIGPVVGRKIFMPLQKHTGKVMVLAPKGAEKVADAVITDRKDLMLGVQVADCVPILLFDRKKSIIAAVHAGWRGTAKGVLKRTVEEMKSKFCSDAKDILMATGPAIRWCCYTVGEEVLKAVRKETGEGDYFMMKNGNICLDLPTANKTQATSVGIPEHNIWMAEECTFCHPDRFFSYRHNKKTAGRQGGFIGLP